MTTFDDALAAVAAGTTPHEAATALVAEMTEDERLWCLDGDAPTWAGLTFLGSNGYHRTPFHAARVERLGLPGFSFSDGPRGVVIGNATCFPVSMARGATWDVDLEERIGDAIGRELRALGANLYGGVCVNVLRHPAWGRAQETYGEDPFPVGEMGAALTRGIQRHAMACVKHFACNSMENARFKVDIEVDDDALDDVYLPHFKRIVDEGVAVVMSAYNSVNGEWCGENERLLTGILRDEWGFDGFVISDWIFGLRDAVKSVKAGLDVEMPYRMIRAPRLRPALDAGELSWADVDACVVRLIATLLRFAPIVSQPAPDPSVVACAEHRALSRQAAAQSIVLLRNEPVDGAPVLPIDPAAGPTIAVLGRLADVINLGDHGSSDVWALECTTALQGLRAAAPGATFTDDPAGADVAIVVVGTTAADEGEFIGETGAELGALFPAADEPEVAARFEAEIAALPPPVVPEGVEGTKGFGIGGDRSSLRLAPDDVDLIRTVAAANPRTVVVLQGGSAFVIEEWVGDVAAVVMAWYGGSEAGHGLADVLFGAVAPSGRLPFSVPTDESHLPPFDRDATHAVYDRWHGWWHLQREGHQPAFAFGFGLSYTTFALEGVGRAGDTITGQVTNTGDRAAADVVHVYAEDRLVGFARVEVDARASTVFEIAVPAAPGYVVARFAGDPDSVRVG